MPFGFVDQSECNLGCNEFVWTSPPFAAQSSVLVVERQRWDWQVDRGRHSGQAGGSQRWPVLLVELEGRSGQSAAVAHRALTSDEVEPSSAGTGDRSPWSAPIGTRTITPDEALVEYLVDHGFRRMARRLAKSGMLEVAATALPGVRDILVLGKIVQLERAGAPDLRRRPGRRALHHISHQRPGTVGHEPGGTRPRSCC